MLANTKHQFPYMSKNLNIFPGIAEQEIASLMETASMTSDSDNSTSNPKDDNLANHSYALSYSSVVNKPTHSGLKVWYVQNRTR